MNGSEAIVSLAPPPPKASNERVWQTRDLALASFCLQHGLEILKATRRGKEFEFVFRDPDNQAADLNVQFANSAEARFDAAMRALKKLCHRGTPRRGTQ